MTIDREIGDGGQTMAWRQHAEHDDHRIIQKGFTHDSFATVARILLFRGVESHFATYLHAAEAERFRTSMRVVRGQARLDADHPYAKLGHSVESWIGHLLDEVDSHVAAGRIGDATEWLDDAFNRLASSITTHFPHHFQPPASRFLDSE